MLAVVAAALAMWGAARRWVAPRAIEPRSIERLVRWAMTVSSQTTNETKRPFSALGTAVPVLCQGGEGYAFQGREAAIVQSVTELEGRGSSSHRQAHQARRIQRRAGFGQTRRSPRPSRGPRRRVPLGDRVVRSDVRRPGVDVAAQ